MYQYLRAKASAWVWHVMRARLLALPKQIVDEREAAELREYTVLMLPKYKVRTARHVHVLNTMLCVLG